ncbi:MAG: STAS/SEC14 domain-containing protein [Anaerolineae bacterium]|jgi:hypothetical protein|nr:STAS/SEC14 domain-containing protein [Anaerolineae bacterium]
MNTTDVPSRTRCRYTVLENGVHEFVMTEISREGVDEFIAALESMAASLPPGSIAPVLFDSRVGRQPVNYMMNRLRPFMKQHRSAGKSGKMAMIYAPSAMINTVDALLRLVVPNLRVRFFKPEERDAALAWLTTP